MPRRTRRPGRRVGRRSGAAAGRRRTGERRGQDGGGDRGVRRCLGRFRGTEPAGRRAGCLPARPRALVGAPAVHLQMARLYFVHGWNDLAVERLLLLERLLAFDEDPGSPRPACASWPGCTATSTRGLYALATGMPDPWLRSASRTAAAEPQRLQSAERCSSFWTCSGARTSSRRRCWTSASRRSSSTACSASSRGPGPYASSSARSCFTWCTSLPRR